MRPEGGAELLVRRVPGVDLVYVVDPRPGVVAMEAFASRPGTAGSDQALESFRDAFTL